MILNQLKKSSPHPQPGCMVDPCVPTVGSIDSERGVYHGLSWYNCENINYPLVIEHSY